MMTKKDFIAFADAIRAYDANADFKFDAEQLEALATFCHSQNPRFNRDRWLGYIRGECSSNGGRLRKPKGETSDEQT